MPHCLATMLELQKKKFHKLITTKLWSYKATKIYKQLNKHPEYLPTCQFPVSDPTPQNSRLQGLNRRLLQVMPTPSTSTALAVASAFIALLIPICWTWGYINCCLSLSLSLSRSTFFHKQDQEGSILCLTQHLPSQNCVDCLQRRCEVTTIPCQKVT